MRSTALQTSSGSLACAARRVLEAIGNFRSCRSAYACATSRFASAIGTAAAKWFNYDPFDDDEDATRSAQLDELPLRVFTTDTGGEPDPFYYDMTVTHQVSLMDPSAPFWVLVAFRCANGFYNTNSDNLNPGYEQGHLLYVQRAELVLKGLTKAGYN